jgi:hypothetical protein
MMDGLATVHFDLLSYSDTQTHPNWLELYNFNVDNGSGGGFSFATFWDPNSGMLIPNTLDVSTDGGVTMITATDTSHMNPRTYSVGDIELKYWSDADSQYYEQPLGSIKLADLSIGPSVSHVWAHAGSGISFDYATAISASALTYTYNTTTTPPSLYGTTLNLKGINIAGSATGDPRYPNGGPEPSPGPYTYQPWGFSGTFKIGTIGDPDVYDYTDPLNPVLIFKGNQPATIDVGTDSSNNTSLFLSQPMSGTIRVADVNFGGQGFGPIILDNIQVHRLNVKISP